MVPLVRLDGALLMIGGGILGSNSAMYAVHNVDAVWMIAPPHAS